MFGDIRKERILNGNNAELCLVCASPTPKLHLQVSSRFAATIQRAEASKDRAGCHP